MALQVILKLCTLNQQEVSDSDCLYRNVVDHAAGEFTLVLFQDVASAPMLPRTKSVRCAACGHGEAVFFQSASFLSCLLQSVQT
jgi:DNA-directed RNA polymerase II subunit RPB9